MSSRSFFCVWRYSIVLIALVDKAPVVVAFVVVIIVPQAHRALVMSSRSYGDIALVVIVVVLLVVIAVLLLVVSVVVLVLTLLVPQAHRALGMSSRSYGDIAALEQPVLNTHFKRQVSWDMTQARCNVGGGAVEGCVAVSIPQIAQTTLLFTQMAHIIHTSYMTQAGCWRRWSSWKAVLL